MGTDYAALTRVSATYHRWSLDTERVPHEVHPEDVHGVRAEQEVERDEGYLFGLRSLLRYVREMKARVESGRFGTYNPSENDLLHTLNLLSPD